MTPEGESDTSGERWALALAAIDVLVAAGNAVGGILLRARPGPVRDAWSDALNLVVPTRRLPASADAEAMNGGLDLTATLASGKPVHRAGILADAQGKALVVPMAERLNPALAARLATAIDDGAPPLVLFDEGDPEDAERERIPQGLADRLAIHIDLNSVRLDMAALIAGEAPPPPLEMLAEPGAIAKDPEAALAVAAAALGIASVRAPIMAVRVARAHARADDRPDDIEQLREADMAAAAALVLGPRATRLPPPPEEEPPPPEEQPDDQPPPEEPPPPPPPSDDNQGDDQEQPEPPPFDPTDMILDAAQTALPPGLLDALAAGTMGKAPKASGSSGAKQKSITSGRPAGVRPGMPGRGARLALIETIKTAAPWQKIRPVREDGRLAIRTDDLRIRRFIAQTQSTTIFAVDASGSAAFARLAEAKGAVELLLAEAYVKRAEVALVAFRGTEAALALPPTRSLPRAKKELAGLAGGGGTPIAAGLDLARKVAEAEKGRGRTPLVVVLTDGRANVGGNAGQSPQDAALASARAYRASGIACVFIDCSPRPRPQGTELANAMGARLVTLPRVDAKSVVAAVKAASGGVT
ncbi:magnesium chelatase subunit D [Sandarakinorhabdus limnophila]|jgi:magnesium chelatase subunit D|uniref:magnesium chelatase subunit D n=1 Tax=Sandarakinorhabdus limnophila TaxID=210512 RepID=UPI0026EFCEF9|nr:magnesium chelatase subunit D [Sandarakinorhabdus limnophila]